MNYEKEYKDVIERAKKEYILNEPCCASTIIERIFPQLAESIETL